MNYIFIQCKSVKHTRLHVLYYTELYISTLNYLKYIIFKDFKVSCHTMCVKIHRLIIGQLLKMVLRSSAGQRVSREL